MEDYQYYDGEEEYDEDGELIQKYDQEDDWDRDAVLDPAWERQQRKVGSNTWMSMVNASICV